MKWLGRSLVMLVLCCLFNGNIVAKAELRSSTIDFVLVVDCTGSLSESDPHKWGVEAAKLFVETLPTENVRVSVIGFGAKWDQTEVYTMKRDGSTYKFVTEAYPLSDAGEEEQNEIICSILERIGAESGEYTQIGYALAAAVDTLEEGEASEDSACIILVSDGRITGQSDQSGQEENYEKYKSIEDAVDTAFTRGWPVYCLELNYDKLNGGTEWQGAQARGQLDHISKGTGGERIEVTGTNMVLRKFTEIIERYFDVVPDRVSYELEDGKATKRFEVAEMTAETNIIITGEELNRIDSIAIMDPDKNTKEYTQSSYSESRRVIFNQPHFIISKLISPKAGWWEVTAYGDDGVEIEVQIIPLQEVELVLNAQNNLSEGIRRGQTIDFTAHFVYNDQSYSSDAFYRESRAYLEVMETGEKFPMEGGTDNYKGTVSFERAGNYTVRAVVEDGIFRNDRKISGKCNIEVKVESAPSELKSIPEQTMPVGSILTLDCSRYFGGGDGGQVTYQVSFDKSVELKCDITQEGVLTIEAGGRSGSVDISVLQKDVDLEEPVEQKFTLVITNEKPQIQGNGEIQVELVTEAKAAMEGVVSLSNLDLQSERVLDLDIYFTDPESLPLRYEHDYDTETEEPGCFTVEIDMEKCVLRAKESGEGKFFLYAVDSDEEASEKITVFVKVTGRGESFFRHTWLIWTIILVALIVLIIVLIVVFGNRKLYGKWVVNVNYGNSVEVQFSQYKQGKKKNCKLSDIINLVEPCNFQSGNVMICAGTRITKNVAIEGLDGELTVRKNEKELNAVSKLVFTKRTKDFVDLIDKNGNTVRIQRKE